MEIKPAIKYYRINPSFFLACKFGHLEIVKWILELKPTINISDNKDGNFYAAFNDNHLEVVKWLLEVKPNIRMNDKDKDIYRLACFINNLSDAKIIINYTKKRIK